MTFNLRNTATDYQSGDELHVEWALNQHFPFGLAAGVGGYLPFDVAVGREISKGVLLSLEVSVPIIRDFPVFNFKTELRMVARF